MRRPASFNVEEQQIEKLQGIAKSEDRSISYLVRQAISRYLSEKGVVAA